MNDMTIPDLTGMTGTLLITTIVFVLTDLLKSVIGIGGNKTAVRYLALVIALGVSFGHRYIGAGERMAWMSAWQALEQAVLSVGGSMGIHVVRSDSNGLGDFIQGLKTRGAEQNVDDANAAMDALPKATPAEVAAHAARMAEARKLLGLDEPQPEPPASQSDMPAEPRQRLNWSVQAGSGVPVPPPVVEPVMSSPVPVPRPEHAQETERLAQLLMEKFNMTASQAFATALRKPAEAQALLGIAGHLPATSPGQGLGGE